jgi:hypothetical protein
MTRELPDSEWEPFLTSFTMQHDRWLVTVELLRGGQREIESRDEPLEGLIVRAGAGNSREIIITVGGGMAPHKRFVITDPTHLRVESENGVDRALEIEGTDGNVTRVAFRSAIAPELVDGIAP